MARLFIVRGNLFGRTSEDQEIMWVVALKIMCNLNILLK